MNNFYGLVLCPPGLNALEVKANGMFFIVAGYDTTATTLAFLLHNLVLHQDVQDKVVDEMQRIMGDKVKNTHNILCQELHHLFLILQYLQAKDCIVVILV